MFSENKDETTMKQTTNKNYKYVFRRRKNKDGVQSDQTTTRGQEVLKLFK